MALTTECGTGAPHDHVVHFYDHDDELAAGVGPYLAEAMRAGGMAIMIATEAHRRAFAVRLADAGINPGSTRADLALAGPGLVMLDAQEAADWLLIDGRLAPHRFDQLIGDLVRRAAAGGRPVQAYGEIVAVLWAAGHVTAALELEELWNGLGRQVGFALYCGYPRIPVQDKEEADAFHEVCRLHSAVLGGTLSEGPIQDLPLEVETKYRWSGRGPGQARRFVAETLVTWGRADLINDAALVVTELATNAILHARTGFTVALSRRREGTIRVAVRDASVAWPRPRRAGPYDGSGRGLALVEALTAGWGTDLLPDGKVVWAELKKPRFPNGHGRPGALLTAS